jgi:hypothetical protein
MVDKLQDHGLMLQTKLLCDVAAEGTETTMKLSVNIDIAAADPQDEPTPPGCIICLGEFEEAWSSEFDQKNSIKVASLSDAIHMVIKQHGIGASAAALIIAPGTDVQDTPALIGAIELLNKIDMPLYVISCASSIDHRLLSQFATLSGGEFALLRNPADFDDDIRSMISKAHSGVRRLGFITIEVPAMMNIESFFTVSPQFGLIQLSVSSRPKNSISFPLLTVGDAAASRAYLLSVSTPPLSSARYHLAHLKLIKNLEGQGESMVEAQVGFTVRAGIHRANVRNSTVARLSDKLQLTTLVEMIAQAYLREDGGSISRMLSTVEAALLKQDLTQLAQRIAKLRVNFLHRGSFALPELNETWITVYTATRALMRNETSLVSD